MSLSTSWAQFVRLADWCGPRSVTRCSLRTATYSNYLIGVACGESNVRIAKLIGARALVWVASLLIIIGVSACPYVVAPRHDYPSEYPVAESIGQCANLNGTFENAGTGLNKSQTASAPSDPILMSTLIMAPGLIPSGTQATTLRISGPALSLLEIEALSADRTIAHASMRSAPEAYGFVHSKPFSSFLCDMYQGRGSVVITNEPVTGATKSSTYEVAVRMYRAKDGSLVVARERVYQDPLYGVDVAHQWFRFQEASARTPAVQ